MRPACESTRRCSLAVGALTPSFWAMKTPHTPSRTRSPSFWGGKWARGSLSQFRTSSRRALATALSTLALSILANLPCDESYVKIGAMLEIGRARVEEVYAAIGPYV